MSLLCIFSSYNLIHPHAYFTELAVNMVNTNFIWQVTLLNILCIKYTNKLLKHQRICESNIGTFGGPPKSYFGRKQTLFYKRKRRIVF